MKTKLKKVLFSVFLLTFAFASGIGLVSCKDDDVSSSVEEAFVPDSAYALILDTYTVQEYTSNVKVFDANGKEVEVNEDGEFMVRTPGTYTIDYGTQKSYLYAFAKIPETDFVYTEDINGKEFIAGDTLTLPVCDLQNVAKDYKEYTVSLMKGDSVLQTFKGGNGNQYFIETSGDYKAVYSFENVFGLKESDTLSFTVVDAQRIVYSKEVENELMLGSEVSYNTYGYYLSEKYDSELTVTTPSGEIRSGKKIVYDEHGEYTLTFSSNVAGTAVAETHKVNTMLDTSSLFSNGANINYVREGVLDEFCLDKNGSPELVGEETLEINASNSAGSIYYSSIIDLSKKTKDDTLIEFYVNKQSGSLKDLNVTLIDVYDPSITVRLSWFQNQWNAGMSYGKVSANNQVFFWKNGDMYDTYFGTVLGCGYTAGTASGSFSCSFDWSTQSVYMSDSLIADFTNEACVPPGFLWSGFTTGEVYLRIDFLDCTNGGIFVKSVDGKAVAGIDLSTLKDENAICLDTQYETLPEGVKGQSYPIPTVFENKVVKCYNVKTSLFYGNENKSSLLAGNSFTPDVAGNYTLYYKGVDSFGKAIVKSYEIQINDAKTPIVINGDFDNQTADIMNYYQIPEFTPSGGHGILTETCSVKLGDRELEKTDKGYFVDGKGTLSVSVKISDYLGNVESKDYTIVVNDNVQLINFKTLPKYVFAGDKIDFGVSAINYKTGGEMDCSVYVNNKKVTGEYVVPSGINSLKVYFYAKDSMAYATTEVYTINVVSTPLTSIKDYVQTDFVSEKLVLSSGVVYKLPASSSDYRFTLPYYLSANEFAFKFGFNEENINANGVTLTLQDSKNADEVVNVYFSALGSDAATIKVNDDPATYSSKWSKGTYTSNCGNLANTATYKGKSYRTMEIVLDIFTNVIIDPSGAGIASIKKYANGEKFQGFTSGAVICSFKVTGVSANSEFILSNVCNQSFGYRVHGDNSVSDTNEPILAMKQVFQKYAYIGDRYKIPALDAFDVLSPGGKVSLSVKAPNGYLVQNHDLMKAYEFDVSQYGTYKLILTVSDSNGNSSSETVNVKVEYDQPPVITINGEVGKTYKVGDKLTIPTYTVEKNSVAGRIDVLIMVRTSEGALYEVSNEYEFKKAGKYQLVYRATDEYYNVTRVVYDITVE